MCAWKDEDIATPILIDEYLTEFKEGIAQNQHMPLAPDEKIKVEHSLEATEKFCKGLIAGRKGKLYMHDLILMAIGFYGGHLTALEAHLSEKKPGISN
jgi:hypothetical protein